MQPIKKDEKWSLPLPILSEAWSWKTYCRLFLGIQDRSSFNYYYFWSVNQNAVLSTFSGSVCIMCEPMNIANGRIIIMEMKGEHGQMYLNRSSWYLSKHHYPWVFMFCYPQEVNYKGPFELYYYNSKHSCRTNTTSDHILSSILYIYIIWFT